MKNFQKALFIALFCTFSGSLIAQLSIGVRAGIGFNNWDVSGLEEDNEIEFENYSSYVFAIPLEIGITKSFAIQPELSFTQKGTFVSQELGELGGIDFGEVSSEYKVTYIEIPVLAKVKVGSETAGLGIFAGPSFSYATKGEIITSFLGETETINIFEEAEDGFSRSDVNIQVGVSPYFKVGDLQLFLDARYLLGVSDLETEEEDNSIKNRSLQLSLGLMFTL